jgi:hypothetical protein
VEALELMMAGPRYPEIQVTTHSPNPLALVAAVRHALRQARVSRNEIRQFSAEALTSSDPAECHEICTDWVAVRETRTQ